MIDCEITVWKNPSVDVIKRLLGRFGELRGLMTVDCLIVWDAYTATHFRVCREQGIGYREAYFLHWRDDCLYWRSGTGLDATVMRKYAIARSTEDHHH